MANRPNILWICTDQQRQDSLGCYGNSIVRSPNIDAIASAGATFRRHITPMQICSPSRATMVTGRYPRHHRLAINGMALPDNIPTLMQCLGAGGYQTHGVGKQHLQPLLAPAELKMPDSRAFWQSSESKYWNGPFYGYQTLDLLLGESDTAHLAGHYANWLNENHPQCRDLLMPEHSPLQPPADLDEIWLSQMPESLHYNTWITDRSLEFLHSRNTHDPFFLFVSYPDPHHPFDPPEARARDYDPAAMPVPRPDAKEREGMLPYYGDLYPRGSGFRELYWAAHQDMEAGSMILTDDISDASMGLAIAYTYAMIEMIDDGVGRIVAELASRGLEQDTVVIFTSDHGELLGDHGLLHKGPPPYRQLTEVACLMKGPGIPTGEQVTGLTSHIDLMPTVLDLCDLDMPAGMNGTSLLPLATGQTDDVREFNFGEYHPTHPDYYNQTVTTRKWRFTIYPNRPEWRELYDLDNDPNETRNLADSGKHGKICAQLDDVLSMQFPPMPDIDNSWLCKW